MVDALASFGSSDFVLGGLLPGYSVRTQSPDFVVEDLEVATTGTYQSTAPAASNGNWVMQMVALRGL